MPTGMLGKLSLAAMQRARDALEERLAGRNGEQVLVELRKFNRGEPCWMQESPVIDIKQVEPFQIQFLEEPCYKNNHWYNNASCDEAARLFRQICLNVLSDPILPGGLMMLHRYVVEGDLPARFAKHYIRRPFVFGNFNQAVSLLASLVPVKVSEKWQLPANEHEYVFFVCKGLEQYVIRFFYDGLYAHNWGAYPVEEAHLKSKDCIIAPFGE